MKKQDLTQDSELDLRYERYKALLEELTIMSDIFMRNVFKSRECTEYILRFSRTAREHHRNVQGIIAD